MAEAPQEPLTLDDHRFLHDALVKFVDLYGRFLKDMDLGRRSELDSTFELLALEMQELKDKLEPLLPYVFSLPAAFGFQENINLKVAALLGQGFRWLVFEDWKKVYQTEVPQRAIEFFNTHESQRGVQRGQLGYHERHYAILDLDGGFLFGFPRSFKVPEGVLFRFKEEEANS